MFQEFRCHHGHLFSFSTLSKLAWPRGKLMEAPRSGSRGCCSNPDRCGQQHSASAAPRCQGSVLCLVLRRKTKNKKQKAYGNKEVKIQNKTEVPCVEGLRTLESTRVLKTAIICCCCLSKKKKEKKRENKNPPKLGIHLAGCTTWFFSRRKSLLRQ